MESLGLSDFLLTSDFIKKIILKKYHFFMSVFIHIFNLFETFLSVSVFSLFSFVNILLLLLLSSLIPFLLYYFVVCFHISKHVAPARDQETANFLNFQHPPQYFVT